MFCILLCIIVVLQIIIITFGGFVFGNYPEYGLTLKQWGLSVSMGVLRLRLEQDLWLWDCC
jgi:hypothetical protein